MGNDLLVQELPEALPEHLVFLRVRDNIHCFLLFVYSCLEKACFFLSFT
jgi:hypothetical protein